MGKFSFTSGAIPISSISSRVPQLVSWLVSMIMVVLSTTTALFSVVSASSGGDVDPGEDFGGYVEELERMEAADRIFEEKLSAHEEWRQTTWAGFCVRRIQAIGRHFRPFFLAIQSALNETSDAGGPKSLSEIAAYLGVRMVVVVGVLMAVSVGAKVFQLFLGVGDYEIVEEVVIVHEHETEEAAAKARVSTTRGKKQKSS